MSLLFRVFALSALLLASSALSGCDNVTCVYTTGCRDTGGPDESLAKRPVDGSWIADSLPTITAVFPKGEDVHPSSPVVLVFSESINADTIEDVFEIEALENNLFQSPIEISSQALLADGRVLVLFPSADLPQGAYRVQLVGGSPVTGNPFGGNAEPQAPGDPVTDLTGQELDVTPGTTIGEVFTVSPRPPDEPRVIATWPPDTDAAASQSTAIVVVFDREIDASTVTDASFDVKENNAAPTLDPVAQPLIVETTETRVFIWQNADSLGVVAPLAVGAQLVVELGKGAPILDLAGKALEADPYSFTIAPFAAPLSATITSFPSDAIGRQNLIANGTEDLTVEVDLLDAEDGDLLDLFLFGTSTREIDPHLIHLPRQIELAGAETITMATFTVSDIDLAKDDDPNEARFADGPVTFAFRLRRGATISPLRVLDVDLTSVGIQDPVLDTIAPTILELEFGGGLTSVSVSNVRDLVLSGTADSVIRSVEVSATDGGPTMTNGTLPPVVGSRVDGEFIPFLAAPVPLGVLASGSAMFTAVAYDEAFNASSPVSGTFLQRGGVGPGVFTNGDTLAVDVFDAETLLPLARALVMVHADMGDGINYPLTNGWGFTAADGTFLLATDVGAIASIVTVDLAGYDLFTFHGVSSDLISIPLVASGFGTSAWVEGDVLAQDAAIELFLPGLDRRMDDSRRASDAPRAYSTAACIPNPEFACAFGPEPIVPGRIGVQTFLAGKLTEVGATSFDPGSVIEAFCLETPLRAVASGEFHDTTFTLPFLLRFVDEDEEKPDELTKFTLDATFAAVTLEDPLVTVEANVPGVAGTVAVGIGLPFMENGVNEWTIRSARPGAVSPTGFFGVNGTVDTDLFVRCELRVDGNVSGVRPRISDLESLAEPRRILTSRVPILTSPAPATGTTGGASYDVRFDDAIPDQALEAGLYRVHLVDSTGRGWTLFKLDTPGVGEISVHVPDVGAAGGMSLADGPIECSLAVFAWRTFAPDEFLWTDIEREHDLFGRAAAVMFMQTDP